MTQESVFDYPNPYEHWKLAKDYVVQTPLLLHAWPHEYMVYQKKSTLEFVIADRRYTSSLMSQSELDTSVESMPKSPCVLHSILYFKNETTIYWVHTESPGSKALEVLFPHMSGMSFFEDDWVRKIMPDDVYPPELDEDNRDDTADEQLPY